jgi:hypothetical protein
VTLGPLEYTVIGFDRPDFQGEIAAEIQKVVDKRIIRLVDVVFVNKDALGKVDIVELDNTTDPRFAPFAGLLEDRMGLLTPEDLASLVDGMPHNSAALVLLFEHRWAVEIKESIGRAGGFLISRDYIVPEALAMLNAELEAEAASA